MLMSLSSCVMVSTGYDTRVTSPPVKNGLISCRSGVCMASRQTSRASGGSVIACICSTKVSEYAAMSKITQGFSPGGGARFFVCSSAAFQSSPKPMSRDDDLELALDPLELLQADGDQLVGRVRNHFVGEIGAQALGEHGVADDRRLLAGPDADQVLAQRVAVRGQRLVEAAVRLARPPGEERIVAVVERVPVGQHDTQRVDLTGGTRGDDRRDVRPRDHATRLPGLRDERLGQTGDLPRDGVQGRGGGARVDALAIVAVFLQEPQPVDERQQRRHLRPARLAERERLEVVLDAVAQQDVVDLAFGVEAVEVRLRQPALPALVERAQPPVAGRRIRHLVAPLDRRLVEQVADHRHAEVALGAREGDERGDRRRIVTPPGTGARGGPVCASSDPGRSPAMTRTARHTRVIGAFPRRRRDNIFRRECSTASGRWPPGDACLVPRCRWRLWADDLS